MSNWLVGASLLFMFAGFCSMFVGYAHLTRQALRMPDRKERLRELFLSSGNNPGWPNTGPWAKSIPFGAMSGFVGLAGLGTAVAITPAPCQNPSPQEVAAMSEPKHLTVFTRLGRLPVEVIESKVALK